MAKRFTLNEAQSLVPQLEGTLRGAVALKSEFDQAEAAVRSFLERVTLMGGMMVNRNRARTTRERRDSLAQRLRSTIEHVQEMGCVVKDLDMGLIDFPTLLRGVEVYLCWKLGEPRIAYWHGTDEGFRGRKPIDEDFLRHHRGDPAQ
ncbi:MAG TPA: DUF2203 domain-containing protein [Bryobacteraceae bacterium]|nr:DUF2203 domain-containing protein [Bryobacteraceae bacterium]